MVDIPLHQYHNHLLVGVVFLVGQYLLHMEQGKRLLLGYWIGV